MITITYRNHGLRITDLWFADCTSPQIRTDILRLHGISNTNEIDKKYVSLQHTLITDLTLAEDELKKEIKSNNLKYEIRRSEKDGISIRHYESNDILRESGLLKDFKLCYYQMFESKGKKTVLNLSAIRQYAKNGALTMSVVFLDEKPIVFHSYVVDGKNVRFFHSCSTFREDKEQAQVIGRANKRLHWEDWLYFKNLGYESYDWGGVFSFDSDDGIDRFKQTFGGTQTDYYIVDIPYSMIGKIAQTSKRVIKHNLIKTVFKVKGKT